MLIARASMPAGARIVAIRIARVHTGLPGGWPTSMAVAVTTYSGQSQYDAPGSTVSRYTAGAPDESVEWCHGCKITKKFQNAVYT